MSDLTSLRDHARAMADWTHPREGQPERSWCDSLRGRLDVQHDRCKHPRCGCECHDRDDEYGPTDRERRLWQQIADEIDAYLAPDDDQPTLEDA